MNNCESICQSYRDESKKKDELIQQLCRIQPHNITDINAIKVITAPRNNEVPSLLVKIEGLEDKIRQKQCDIDLKNEQLAVMKKDCELNRLEVEKFSKENRKLIESNKKTEETVQTYESLKHRSEYTIKQLQDQYRNSQSKVAELEARIRNHLSDREKVDSLKSTVESKYQTFLINLSKFVSVDNFADTDAIMDKLASITEQNAYLNGKMHSTEEKLKGAENDAKAARETIVKLMKDFEGVGQSREDLKETKTKFQSEKADLKAQMDLLNNRLESLQKLYDSAKDEIESKTNKLLGLEIKLKEHQFASQASDTVLQSLLESLAAMIGTPFAPCASNEGAVKERVKQLVKTVKDQSAAADMLDQRVLMLQKQFESQYETGKQLMDRTKDSDNVRQDLLHKIKVLEDELAAQDILKDNIKCEKERLCRHINKIADLLQVDYLPSDKDTMGLLDLLEGRCQELLLKVSGGSPKCPKCAMMNNPSTDSQKQSKRIMTLKEELEAKDLKIQLLEKRLNDNSISGNGNLVSCRRDNETNCDRVHRLQHQLQESQNEIEELRRALVRSQSADFEIHKQIKQQQQEELEQLTVTVEKLDKVRQRQAKKIAGLKSQVEEKSHVLMHQSKRDSEFKQARQLVEELRRREIKLIEFRASVAQMLGVDTRCSPDPDGEIRMRVQKLMTIARSAVNTPFTPYYLSQDLGPSFQQGYSNPSFGCGSPNQVVPYATQSQKTPLVTFEDNAPSFSKRSQMPKNKILFQSADSKSKLNRPRSTSPTRVDARKY